MLDKITVTILTKNSEKYLYKCLDSLSGFNEIIILDNGSTDGTLNIAKKFKNVKIFENDFIGFGPLKNLAITYSKNDWILSLDSDEILTQNLKNEINNYLFDKKCIYSLHRNNFYKNKLIKACGWDNDYVNRIFNRTSTTFNNKQVHESLELKDLKIIKLSNTIEHYSFSSISELILKMQMYSSLWAKENRNKKKSSPLKAISRGVFSFVKNYFFQKGFLYGYEGLVISISNANGVFYKYIKLYEENLNDS